MSRAPIREVLEQHPLSAAFPAMSAVELSELVEDIKATTLRNPIMMYEGKVLDGWHRYQACLKAGKPHLTSEYTGHDPVAYVKSQNWHRRHLEPGARAVIALKLNAWLMPGRPATGVQTETSLNRPVYTPPKSNADLAAEAGVGETTIKAAKRVLEHGSTALQQAVGSGKMPAQRAAEIAKLPKAEQQKAMREPVPAKPAAKATGDYVALQAKYDALLAEHEEMAGNYQVMASELATLQAFHNGAEVQEMNTLRELLRNAERRRDELEAENNVMRDQIARMKRQAGKAAA